jgi:hypothetical protein
MIAGWDRLTEIIAYLGQSGAQLGAALLGTVVRPSWVRTRRRRSPLSSSKMPSSHHQVK